MAYGAWVTVSGARRWQGPYSLADAQLGPLELLASLPQGLDGTAGRLASRLATQLAREVTAATGQPAEVEIDPHVRGADGTMSSEDLPLALFMAAAQALRSCLWAARAADTRDVASGDRPSTADAVGVTSRETDLSSAARRTAEALRTGLGPQGSTTTLLAALDTAARWHLDGAATTAGLRHLVVPGGDEVDHAALVTAATSVLAELDARLAVRDALGVPNGDEPVPDALTLATARIRALLPEALVLPPFALDAPDTLAASATRSRRRTGGAAETLGRLSQIGRAREQVGAAANAVDLLEVATGIAFDPVLTQLPDLSEEGWAATTLPESAGPRTCLLALAWPAAEQLTGPVSGLVVDAWTEVIPDRRVISGVAVHVDAPSAKAPQSLLLALPPTGGDWSFEEVLGIFRETLDRARQRAVGPEQVEGFGQFLPAVYLADDTDPGPAMATA